MQVEVLGLLIGQVVLVVVIAWLILKVFEQGDRIEDLERALEAPEPETAPQRDPRFDILG